MLIAQAFRRIRNPVLRNYLRDADVRRGPLHTGRVVRCVAAQVKASGWPRAMTLRPLTRTGCSNATHDTSSVKQALRLLFHFCIPLFLFPSCIDSGALAARHLISWKGND